MKRTIGEFDDLLHDGELQAVVVESGVAASVLYHVVYTATALTLGLMALKRARLRLHNMKARVDAGE